MKRKLSSQSIPELELDQFNSVRVCTLRFFKQIRPTRENGFAPFFEAMGFGYTGTASELCRRSTSQHPPSKLAIAVCDYDDNIISNENLGLSVRDCLETSTNLLSAVDEIIDGTILLPPSYMSRKIASWGPMKKALQMHIKAVRVVWEATLQNMQPMFKMVQSFGTVQPYCFWNAFFGNLFRNGEENYFITQRYGRPVIETLLFSQTENYDKMVWILQRNMIGDASDFNEDIMKFFRMAHISMGADYSDITSAHFRKKTHDAQHLQPNEIPWHSSIDDDDTDKWTSYRCEIQNAIKEEAQHVWNIMLLHHDHDHTDGLP